MYSGGPLYNWHPMITVVPTISKALLPAATFVTQFENVFPPPRSTSLRVRAVRKGLSLWLKFGAFGTLLRDSDRLIVLSSHQLQTLSKRCPAVDSKSICIPPPPLVFMSEDNGASRQRGRERLGVQPDDFLLVYFGYIYASKGVETLLEAFHRVASRRSQIRLIMVGGNVEFPSHISYGREMSALSKQLGIDDKVIWTGAYATETDEASVYLRAADVCVLPFNDGVRLNNSSFAAAAAHGLPIITTQGAMIEPPFMHQKNVFLCPPQNPEAMAAAIETLMDSPDLRRRLRIGALELAREWFSWESAIERTIATLS
jgi:glycosyltransferase involved in cell wall biosynthesis